MYYEDTDFCLRARAAGYSIVYEPQAVVWHEEGGSSGGAGSPFAVYYTTRNRPYIVRKFAPPRVYARFTAYYLASRLARAAAYAGRRRADLLRAMLLAMADFYRGRMGMTLQP